MCTFYSQSFLEKVFRRLKAFSDDSDDLNKSSSGNFVHFSIGYLSKKVILAAMTKERENPGSLSLFLFCLSSFFFFLFSAL